MGHISNSCLRGPLHCWHDANSYTHWAVSAETMLWHLYKILHFVNMEFCRLFNKLLHSLRVKHLCSISKKPERIKCLHLASTPTWQKTREWIKCLHLEHPHQPSRNSFSNHPKSSGTHFHTLFFLIFNSLSKQWDPIFTVQIFLL